MSSNDFYYSPKYYDDKYEYRHVVLPKELVKLIPKSHLMSEKEWREIGIQQSEGWIHYMVHKPEPHVVLFKRPITSQPQNRLCPPSDFPSSMADREKPGWK